jgi:Sec-independent protein translocase protein TatA
VPQGLSQKKAWFMVLPLAFLDFFGFQGILLLAILGVLLYGERLPEVAAKFGKHLTHLRKAAQAVRSEIESVVSDTKYSVSHGLEGTTDATHEEATAPKFEPPPLETSSEPSSAAVPAEVH